MCILLNPCFRDYIYRPKTSSQLKHTNCIHNRRVKLQLNVVFVCLCIGFILMVILFHTFRVCIFVHLSASHQGKALWVFCASLPAGKLDRGQFLKVFLWSSSSSSSLPFALCLGWILPARRSPSLSGPAQTREPTPQSNARRLGPRLVPTEGAGPSTAPSPPPARSAFHFIQHPYVQHLPPSGCN